MTSLLRFSKTSCTPLPVYWRLCPSPVGRVLLAGSVNGLRILQFQDGAHPVAVPGDWQHDSRSFQGVVEQLEQFFAGYRKRFQVKLDLQGTPFQLRVWKALQRIPYGKTVSYGELAVQIGNPQASRAVGAANGRNPVSIIVPCHRVIGANGRLVGYGGGLPIKTALLELEKAHSAGGRMGGRGTRSTAV
jgi:methylated-DNA-[protein]-cysteine S-methyltransferase